MLLVLIAILLAVPLWQTFRQNKQLREIRQMQEQLVPGMEVVTGSGMHGIVVDTTDETVDLAVADGVVTRWQRGAVARNLTVEQHKAAKEEKFADDAAQLNNENSDTTKKD